VRRVECRRHGVVAVEELPWGDRKHTLTKAYMLFLARLRAATVMGELQPPATAYPNPRPFITNPIRGEQVAPF
jgi:hypothetical protein